MADRERGTFQLAECSPWKRGRPLGQAGNTSYLFSLQLCPVYFTTQGPKHKISAAPTQM